MKKKGQKQFIRAWRKFRGLTQEQLAERMGIARSYVGHVEGGKRRYDQLFLEAAADALQCTPADLIMRDPSLPDPWADLQAVPDAERPKIINMIRAYLKTGTDG